MGKQQITPREEEANQEDDDEIAGGFHNPLFSSTSGVPKDRRCVPAASYDSTHIEPA